MTKMLPAIALLSALVLSAHRAAADDAAPELKDRGTAFALSAGGTAASIGLVLVGSSTSNSKLTTVGVLSSLVTPAAGEIYATGGNPFTLGLALRVVSAGAAIAGAFEISKCLFIFDEDTSCHADAGQAKTLLVVGAIGYASGIVYDIAMAGRAVDDYNQGLHLRVTPTVIPTASSGPAVGLGIGGSF